MASRVRFLDRRALRCGCRWVIFHNSTKHKILSSRHLSSWKVPNKHFQYWSKHGSFIKQCRQVLEFINGRRYSSQKAHIVSRTSRRTYYDILEVHPAATQPEIKSAYYELSLKYHPDVNSSPDAGEIYTEITKAYSVLSKIESRREYDKEIGTYYMMKSYSRQSNEKVLRLMDDLLEIDMKDIKQQTTFLHNAVSLSIILNTPVRFKNVKHKTGVESFDMRMLQLLRKVSNGVLVAAKESSVVTFIPSEVQSGMFEMEAGRYGSISLLIESALPCLLFGPIPEYSRSNILSLKGATHCNYGLNMDIIEKIYGPLMARFGLKFSMDLRKRSYVPNWGGKVVLRSLPTTHIKSVSMTDIGDLTKITGWCSVAGSKPIRVAQVMAKKIHLALKKNFPKVPKIVNTTKERDSRIEGNGQTIIIVGKTSTGITIGGAALWQKGMPVDKVINKAVGMFTRHAQSGSCVDEVLQDKVILMMALARGHSTIRTGPLTARTLAAISAVELLTEVKFDIKEHAESVVISCYGLGITNDYLGDDDVTSSKKNILK